MVGGDQRVVSGLSSYSRNIVDRAMCCVAGCGNFLENVSPPLNNGRLCERGGLLTLFGVETGMCISRLHASVNNTVAPTLSLAL